MESREQSSCRGQEDGDGSERPLKKARFAWQVKGKHHQKNETNPAFASPSGEIQGSASAELVTEHVTNKTNSCDSRKSDSQGYAKNDDSNHTIAHENSTKHNSSSSRSQNYSYDRSLDVRDIHELNPFRIASQSIENSLEDQYLLQWQTQQMVACCIDNTINRITERRMQAPSTTGSSLRALNMAQFLNHLPGDNTIENEGILMAISAHGLRNNTSVTHCDDDSDEYDEIDDKNIPIFPSIFQEPIVTNEVPIPNPEPEASEDNEDDVGFFEDIPESSEDDSLFQFMNAAVQFAISSKGLTASGT